MSSLQRPVHTSADTGRVVEPPSRPVATSPSANTPRVTTTHFSAQANQDGRVTWGPCGDPQAFGLPETGPVPRDAEGGRVPPYPITALVAADGRLVVIRKDGSAAWWLPHPAGKAWPIGATAQGPGVTQATLSADALTLHYAPGSVPQSRAIPWLAVKQRPPIASIVNHTPQD